MAPAMAPHPLWNRRLFRITSGFASKCGGDQATLRPARGATSQLGFFCPHVPPHPSDPGHTSFLIMIKSRLEQLGGRGRSQHGVEAVGSIPALKESTPGVGHLYHGTHLKLEGGMTEARIAEILGVHRAHVSRVLLQKRRRAIRTKVAASLPWAPFEMARVSLPFSLVGTL